MDIFGLTRMRNLMNNRGKQLARQVHQNDEIVKHQDECPKDIIKFFIYSAQINTILSNKIYKSSLFNILDNINQNLDNHTKEQNAIQDIINSKDFCSKLKEYTLKQEKQCRTNSEGDINQCSTKLNISTKIDNT